MPTISSLTVELRLQANNFNNQLRAAQREVKEMEKTLRPVKDLAKEVGTVFVATGLIVGGALIAMAKKSADFGDSILEASQKTGIGTKELAAYKLMAEQSGSSFEGITKGVALLSKQITAAAAGKKEAIGLFNALGVSVKDAGGNMLSTSEILPQIADRFTKIEDGALKSAIAQKLFGKSGAELIPLLNGGSEAIKRAQELTEKYNTSLNKAEANLGNNFNDAVEESKAAMLGFANAIGVALLPAMTKAVQIGNEWIAWAAQMAKANPGVTKSIAAMSAVITGAGGLLLGLAGVATIWPKVKLGIDMIGGAAMLGRAGLIGMAAATGILVGQWINGKIAASGYQKEVDSIINSLAKVSLVGMPFAERGEAAAGAEKSRAFTEKGAAEFLKKRGMTMEQAQAASDALYAKGQKLRASQQGTAQSTSELDAWMKKLTATFGGAAEATPISQTDQMWNSLKREAGETEALIAVLTRANAAHVSLDTVLDKLGPTIADVADEFRKSGQVVPEIIQYYDFLRRNSLELAEAQQQEAESLAALNKLLFENEAARQAMLKGASDVQAIQEVQIDRGPSAAQDIIDARNAMEAQRAEATRLAQSIKILASAGYSLEQIEESLGISIESVAKKTGDQALGAMVAADAMRNSWGEALGRVSDQLVDMIVDFDFSFKRLGDIAKNTAKDMARSFLDGFFKPFKDALTGIGQKAGQWAAGLLFGGGGGVTGPAGGGGGAAGLLGGILGGGGGLLGGIFGKGSAATPPIIGNTGGAGGVAATGMSSALGFASLGASLLGPIAGAVGKIGSGRRSANDIVGAQNAFINQTLAGILSDSSLSATNKLKMVDNAWAEFQGTLDRHAAAGGKNALTANQAFATVSPTVSGIRQGLIGQGANDAETTGGGGHTFNITINAPSGNGEAIAAAMWDVLHRNLSGFTEETVRQVQIKHGAVTAV
jgi:TP901 family phage tail tape measure protein